MTTKLASWLPSVSVTYCGQTIIACLINSDLYIYTHSEIEKIIFKYKSYTTIFVR